MIIEIDGNMIEWQSKALNGGGVRCCSLTKSSSEKYYDICKHTAIVIVNGEKVGTYEWTFTGCVYATANKDAAIRKSGSKDAAKIGSISVNDVVTVLDRSKKYWKILYNGTIGYVYGDYLDLQTR